MQTKQDKIIKVITYVLVACAAIALVITIGLGGKEVKPVNGTGANNPNNNITDETLKDVIDGELDNGLVELPTNPTIGLPEFGINGGLDNVGGILGDITEETTKETETVKPEDETEQGTEEETSGNTEEETGEPEEDKEPSPFLGMFMSNTTDILNIRQEPNTNSAIVGKLYEGSGGKVLKKGEEWSLIQSGAVIGYVSNKYVVFDEEAEEKAWDTAKITAVSTTDYLRIRQGFTTKDKVIAVINTGTKVNVFEKGDMGWSQVQYGKYMGYIHNDYLEFTVTVGRAMTLEEEEAFIKSEEERKRREAEEAARKKAEAEAALREAIANSKLVETVKTSPYNVTEEEAYLLACLVTAESRGEIYEGQLAVANVVLNRLRSGIWGKTIKDVIYSPYQFSVVGNQLERFIKEGPHPTSLKAAKEALSGVNNVPDYLYFRTTNIANYSKYKEYTIIDHMVYYRLK